MAKPIKETPILKGQDAINFIDRMENSDKKKVNDEKRAKIKENFARLSAISNFG